MARYKLPLILSWIVRLLASMLVAVVCGTVLWRVFFSTAIPKSMKTLVPNERLAAAYEQYGDALTLRHQDLASITKATGSYGYFSVEEVVRLGRYAYAPTIFSRHGGEEQAVHAALEQTGLYELRHQNVLTLSGGELQRTFLAQTFAQDPKLLLLDEPTNHLDLVYQKQVFELIQNWLKQEGRAVISVVHDLSLARAYGTRALLLDRGQVVADGTMAQVFSDEVLDRVYHMDVRAWMNRMLAQWKEA